MKKEKIGQDFFFPDCEYRGLKFWGWQVGNGISANESVSKKTKEKKRIRSKERDSVGSVGGFLR